VFTVLVTDVVTLIEACMIAMTVMLTTLRSLFELLSWHIDVGHNAT